MNKSDRKQQLEFILSYPDLMRFSSEEELQKMEAELKEMNKSDRKQQLEFMLSDPDLMRFNSEEEIQKMEAELKKLKDE